MKLRNTVVAVALATATAACSLPPERPVYREELYRTKIYQTFTIKDTPESVLAALNRDGEVVVEGTLKDKAYYIRIYAAREGLQVKVFEK